eukprot:5218711-Pyramimonas_sp.AAC.1
MSSVEPNRRAGWPIPPEAHPRPRRRLHGHRRRVYALFPRAIGSRSGYMLSNLTRLAPASRKVRNGAVAIHFSRDSAVGESKYWAIPSINAVAMNSQMR